MTLTDFSQLLHDSLCYIGLHAWRTHRRGPRHAEAWSDCANCEKKKNVVAKVRKVEAPLFDGSAESLANTTTSVPLTYDDILTKPIGESVRYDMREVGE